MLFSLLFDNSMGFKEKVIVFLTFTLAVMFALTVHEFAHAFTAYKLGDKTAKLSGRMTFNPMAHLDIFGILCFVCLGFGWAKPVPINPFNFTNIKRDTFLVSLSGIVTNFIYAFIFYPIAILFSKIMSLSFFYVICYYLFIALFQVNLVFAVFNLLPIYPLDGFNALSSQLKYGNKYVLFMQRYGTLVLLGVILVMSQTGIFSILVNIVGYPMTALWDLILG